MQEIEGIIGDSTSIWISIIVISIIFILIVYLINKKIRSAFGDFSGNKPPIKNGIPTLGILKSYSQTGVFINEQPQIRMVMDVLDENGNIFTGELKSVFQLTELHQLQVGMHFSVMYNPAKPEKLALNPNPDYEKMQDLVDRYESQQPGSTMSYEERSELRKKGQNALALVKNVDLTGKNLDEKVETTIEVEITKASQEKVNAERTLFLEKEQLKMIQVGQHIDVIYLPGREDNFSIKFDLA